LTQQCPLCEAALPERDRFCEVCGTALPQPERTEPVCPRCGAGPAEIDHEGFCCACGFRREERGRDHVESVISPAFAGISDRGLRHHRNEDYLALKIFPAAAEAEPTSVLIVCDGVSSVHDPDVASAAAAERTSVAFEEFLNDGRLIDGEAMQAAIDAAQASVADIPYSAGAANNRAATTIVAAAVHAGCITIGWRGDSRAYWIGPDEATPLTVDHSWYNGVMQSGEMSEAEALQSPDAHAITNWLGADAPTDVPPAILQFEIPGPGKLLLCSDGLWNYAPRAEALHELVQSFSGDAIDCCRGLVDFARSKGGNDNITVAVLTIGDLPKFIE
jgi:serine/threonine protein phosphatase PrpC